MAERTCSIEGCTREYRARGFCPTHWARWKKYGDPNFVQVVCVQHGLRKHPNYDSWYKMNKRCNNPRHKQYKDYGGRGITVCRGWQEIQGLKNFIKDMGERPKGQTIDRIDNDGGYWCGHCEQCVVLNHPSNCRWLNHREQALNRRTQNKTGFQGVYKIGDRFRSYIQNKHEHIYLGTYNTAEEASSVYQKARVELNEQ